jgi:signal transduction histidine kinase
VSSGKENTVLAKLRHDLRTPINHIIGYSELLREDLADQGVSRLSDLDKIQTAARQVLDIIGTQLTEEHVAADKLVPPSEAAASAEHEKITSALQFAVSEVSERRSEVVGRILVVDDQPENRDVLVRHLERQGHKHRTG